MKCVNNAVIEINYANKEFLSDTYTTTSEITRLLGKGKFDELGYNKKEQLMFDIDRYLVFHKKIKETDFIFLTDLLNRLKPTSIFRGECFRRKTKTRNSSISNESFMY